ncbi:MAG: hypothetical protein Q8O14_03695 [bacterium]|nr:hypothetical protein [bacterium]
MKTINHLWATRNQLLKFDTHFHFERAAGDKGPALHFLAPKLTREDVRALVSGREPSTVTQRKGGEVWVFRYLRRPPMRGKAIHLELEFQGDLLTRVRVDKRFSDHLGDDRIEMLVRQFVGRDTELDLFSKRVVCKVPTRELARFRPLTQADVHALFGKESLVREVELKPHEPKFIYRYRLAGTAGSKAAMSFGATYLDNHRLARITSRIGSFSLEFDLSGQP